MRQHCFQEVTFPFHGQGHRFHLAIVRRTAMPTTTTQRTDLQTSQLRESISLISADRLQYSSTTGMRLLYWVIPRHFRKTIPFN